MKCLFGEIESLFGKNLIENVFNCVLYASSFVGVYWSNDEAEK